MKALKKLTVILLAVMMLAGAVILPVGAKNNNGNNGNGNGNNGKGNGNGAAVCVVETKSLSFILAEGIAETANATVEALVKAAQKCKNPDIKLLVATTSAVTNAAILAIRLLGYDAQCVYEEYKIGNQTVLIDPIIVIKRDFD